MLVEFFNLAISLQVNIKARSILIFSPSEKDEYEKVSRAVQTSQKVGLAWAVELQKDKKIVPFGVLLVTKAQLLLKTDVAALPV